MFGVWSKNVALLLNLSMICFWYDMPEKGHRHLQTYVVTVFVKFCNLLTKSKKPTQQKSRLNHNSVASCVIYAVHLWDAI